MGRWAEAKGGDLGVRGAVRNGRRGREAQAGERAECLVGAFKRSLHPGEDQVQRSGFRWSLCAE